MMMDEMGMMKSRYSKAEIDNEEFETIKRDIEK
jgi:uncharacterized membrane protein